MAMSVTEARARYSRELRSARLVHDTGRIRAISGLVIEAAGCDVHLGELVEILPARGGPRVLAEAVGLHEDRFQLMPHSATEGLCLQSRIRALGTAFRVPVGAALLGRVLTPMGEPLDAAAPPETTVRVPSLSAPINPLHRLPITHTLETGIRAVDLFTPLGRGQRLGIFSGSGVGKSTLLGMLAKHTRADVIVIALVGERGREVGDFLRHSLGGEGLARAVVIVATAEQPAVVRRQGPYTATAIAEWFRAQGQHVLLIVDSMTRFAMAQREIGLATGEPMGSRGYPPSVFGLMPPLLERAGALEDHGSITAVYTVLVEGDDMNEPVADHMRAILDGHIVLSRDLAARNHYPAIDVLHSISRLAGTLLTAPQRRDSDAVRAALATYAASADLVELGAYQAGSNRALDAAIRIKPDVEALLKQAPDIAERADAAWQKLAGIAGTTH
jgi:flagellum-specific ATP synthase